MTVADTNVRPAWWSRAASARGTRRLRLARLLLNPLGRLLRKLDLTFLVLLAVAPTPACIIPVGPEWQDPRGFPNAPPMILDPDPFWGEEVTHSPSFPFEFEFFVTDANVEDPLRVQGWVDESPRRRFLDITIPGAPGGTRVPAHITKTIVCNDIDGALESHKVIVAVTDREFVNDGTDNILAVTSNGQRDQITWTLHMKCLAQ